MGPRDWMETIKEAIERIGTTKDTGGSTTAGTLMGKLNAALSKINTIYTATGKIGSTGDTGGSQTAGTVFGKENAILEVLKNGGMPVVKSIQSGRVSVGGKNRISEITISKVNPSKCIVLVDTVSYTNGSYVHHSYFESLTETTLKIVWTGSGGYESAMVNWQVIEFY